MDVSEACSRACLKEIRQLVKFDAQVAAFTDVLFHPTLKSIQDGKQPRLCQSDHQKLSPLIGIMEPEGEHFYECQVSPPRDALSKGSLQREGVTVSGSGKNEGTPRGSLDEGCSENSTSSGRSRLPCPMQERNDFGIWSILKQCIGKELSKITMPISFNEPLSFLQRVAEYLEYSHLLQMASDCQDPVGRHELVTAFAVSACASNWERVGKPFNPLLGETYELTREDLGFRMVCEQVSHHPPITAFHVDSPIFTFSGSIHPKLKFWGKSVEVTPKGIVTLYLKRHCEAYSWQFVNCYVHNIIVGKLWIEHYGAMEVTNHRSNWKSVLNFRPSGWFGRDMHKIMGHLFDRKQKLRVFYGKWTNAFYSYGADVWEDYQHVVANHSDSQLKSNPGKDDRFNILEPKSLFFGLTKAISEPSISSNDDSPLEHVLNDSFCDLNLPGQKVLWKATPKPKDHALNNCSEALSVRKPQEKETRSKSEKPMERIQSLVQSIKYYGFTLFAMNLNALDDAMRQRLPPTDCRFRPDIRLLEEGQMDAAAEEKDRLEEKQRAARKDEKRDKDGQQPTWFVWERNQHTGVVDWQIRGDYWKREWQNCPSIY